MFFKSSRNIYSKSRWYRNNDEKEKQEEREEEEEEWKKGRQEQEQKGKGGMMGGESVEGGEGEKKAIE